MNFIKQYQSINLHSEDEVFAYLIANLKGTIDSCDFFVAWDKVFGNVSKIEVALNIMNSLIGKQNIEAALTALIKQYPEVVTVIPLLIAERHKTLNILGKVQDIQYCFTKKKHYSDEDIEAIVNFSKECGLLKILSDKSIKNLVDYAIGIEVGLDTNARKNRRGKAMENLTELYVKAICKKHGFKYIAQATARKIEDEFGKKVNTDKAKRQFDFAIDVGNKIYLIEVNYYSGGGSKLKSVAGEFSSLFALLKNNDTGFIWVTDGKGWETAKHPLRETFDQTDYIMNLKMIDAGLLEQILVNKL